VLLYFSGHGLKNDSNNLYFAMTDTKRRYLESTAVSSWFVREMMQKCSARRQILLLDCCFSGAFPRGWTFRADETIGSGHYFDVKGSGQAILTASDDMQYAFEDDEVTMQKVTPSMFTEIVVEGVGSGKADTDLDGKITLDDLHAYVLEGLRARNSSQHPQKWYFGLTDDIVLATNPNPHVRALAEELRSRLESENVGVRCGAVIDLGKLARGSDGRRGSAAIKALEALTKDDSKAVSAAAKSALSDILGEVVGQTNEKLSGAKENIGLQASPIVGSEGDVRQQPQPEKKAKQGNNRSQSDHLTPYPHSLKGHTHSVRSVTFSPDGALLASGSLDKTVRLWRVSDGTPVRTLEVHTSWHAGVTSVAFSPDGALLASGSDDKTVCLWRVADGTLVRTLPGHTHWVRNVAFSPDGALLASGSRDRTVRVWRAADGSLVRALEGHLKWVPSVAFSPDGALLASGSLDKTVRLWSVVDGTRVCTLAGHTHWVTSVAFSPDGALLASGSYDKTVRLWRVADGTLARTVKAGWLNCVRSVAFSPDGALLASGDDSTVRLWFAADGTLARTVKAWLNCVRSVAFSPDGALLASGGDDSTVRLWFGKEPIHPPTFAQRETKL
jgi:WD40 repeat protein